MNATLSLLGTVMLILIGVAFVLAVLILILYEAHWVIRISKRLSRSISVADETAVARSRTGTSTEGSDARAASPLEGSMSRHEE